VFYLGTSELEAGRLIIPPQGVFRQKETAMMVGDLTPYAFHDTTVYLLVELQTAEGTR